MLKLSMTALLFVTTGTVNQLVIKAPLVKMTEDVITFVTVLLNRTTARVAISYTT